MASGSGHPQFSDEEIAAYGLKLYDDLISRLREWADEVCVDDTGIDVTLLGSNASKRKVRVVLTSAVWSNVVAIQGSTERAHDRMRYQIENLGPDEHTLTLDSKDVFYPNNFPQWDGRPESR